MKYLILALSVLVLVVTLSGSALAQTQERTVEGLIFDLKHPDPERRKEAAGILGQNEVREAVPALIEVTKDSDETVRLAAARALVQINDTRALQAFIELTRDPSVELQKLAIDGIVKIYVVDTAGFVDGVMKVVNFMNPLSDDYNSAIVESYVPVSKEAVVSIGDLLFSGDRSVREKAATAVGILRGKDALPAVQDALTREDSNSVKVELVRAVYKIGDTSAGEALIPLIRDPDKKVHDEAILTVGRLGVKKAVAPLNDLYSAGVEERKKIFGLVPVSGKDDLQRKVLEALAYIGDPSSQDIFEGAVSDERPFYRRFGSEGLGRMGDASYLSLLARNYLREKDSGVKLAMSFALFKLGREEHLVELVDRVGNDQAYYYLLELSPEETRKLYSFIQSERKPVKIRLLDVIGVKGDASAIEVAEEFTRSEDPEIASASNLAIRRLRARYP